VADSSHKTLAEDTVAGLPGVVRVKNELVVAGTEPAVHSDAWIATKVKTALLFHRNVSYTGTTVYVNDGVVTLQGVADSQAEKELTTEYAKDIDNVKSVVNNMTIANTPIVPDSTVGDKIDDASITAQIKTTLLTHHSTSAIKTSVSTSDGVVTITGVASNDAEVSLVTKLVTDINGVVSVNNLMTVSSETR
jgi:osmotically-inducible protein OsmY